MIERLLLSLLLLSCLMGVSNAATLNQGNEPVPPTAQELTLYIGTYTKDAQGGICRVHFNPQTGELGPAQTLVATSNPAFLAASADGRFLYAVNEWGRVAGEDKGGISAFRVEPATHQLSPLNAFAVGGNLCHLTMDATGKWLFGAAYGTGTVLTWPILEDGSIGPQRALVQHTGSGPNEKRQTSAHAHHVVLAPDNRRVFVADLGIDKVTIDDFDPNTGELATGTPPSVALSSGAGPRHLALSPSGQFLYVVSELNNTITAFKDALGSPTQIQVISTLPPDVNDGSFAAEIAVRPDGRFLYASNRGHNSIACYSTAQDGQLTLVGFAKTGHTPRHFTFDPSGKWLLAANQDDNSITVFSVDEQSGVLTQRNQLENVPDKPICLLFARG